MAYIIEWTAHARNELDTVYNYLENNWNSREIIRFSQLLEKKLSVIIKLPFIYPAYERNKAVRRCVISKQISLYYQIIANRIIVLSLFDNRQAPDKLMIFES
ncbi:MAG: type II toxin-antitoxin system RelE/ParE family toxin [Prevotellaceae bacterium]|jgi:plasmid stabilization system protein ParE|nr:type II toxin-antitoxin system RelE/ParE family toxin [Prevotellaceae bacterium]